LNARPEAVSSIVDAFHRLYYDQPEQTWDNIKWMGVRTQKCPMDLWLYQEIIFELQPDIIIETGTCAGGTTLFLATICDVLDRGRIFTIDIDPSPTRPKHKRIRYLLGSSTDPEIVDRVRGHIRPKNRVMAILDSDHSKDHVLNEIHAYAPMVTPGSYLIVEDTNINGHPVNPEFGPGPMEAAVHEFLSESRDFEVDHSREKLLLTFNPGGWLRRVR
jgi:cephalosporin hydroxylase